MKQMMMTLVAAFMISSAAYAQDNDNRKQEMIKHRTEQTVKDYNLNDQQAKDLLALNTKYADKMRPPRHHGPHGKKGERPEPPKGDKKGDRPAPPKGDMKEKRAEMDATMKAYDAELQKIMTPDQFTRYKADMEKRHKDHKRGPRPE